MANGSRASTLAYSRDAIHDRIMGCGLLLDTERASRPRRVTTTRNGPTAR